MLRRFALAVILSSCLAAAGWAQSPSATNAPAASTPANTSAKPATKKAAPKAKSAAKPPGAVDTGPCKLGVISALGDRFTVQKFGLTVFETEESETPVDGWGLDDLVVARVRAATGADPTVRKIIFPKSAFEPFYHPTSRFLPDPREGLPAIVRGITPNANCERYLVVTRFKGQVPNTNLTLDGIGVYSQGIGSIVRHSHLFANISLSLLDGGNYERVNRPFTGFGARLAEGLRLTEDPLTKLDNSFFPETAASVPGNATLRERTRTLIAAQLDKTLPNYLKDD
jgi:hypothetical protein